MSSPMRFAAPALALVMGVALALSGSAVGIVLAAAGLFLYLLFGAVSVREPMVFVAVFLLALEVFPPLYLPVLGDTPLYLSFLLSPSRWQFS